MENVSLILPKKLGEKLKGKAEEMGSLPEELGIEFVRKGLNEELDPEELVEHYHVLSEKYFAEAREFLNKGDLVQTSEKLWGAASLAIKMTAAKRGLKMEKHGSLWEFVSKLSDESGDNDFIRLFYTANALHRNFYENQMNQKALEIASKDIEQLIAKLKDISQ